MLTSRCPEDANSEVYRNFFANFLSQGAITLRHLEICKVDSNVNTAPKKAAGFRRIDELRLCSK